MGAAPRVVVYGRPGCHLCEVAEDVVARVCRAAGARWEVISVADDPQLLALYGELIPVVTVDGRALRAPSPRVTVGSIGVYLAKCLTQSDFRRSDAV